MTKLTAPWKIAIVLIALILSACGAQGGADESEEPASSDGGEVACNVETDADGVLQPLADGFPEREMTIIVADNPTAADTILAQTLAESARNYSPVAIEVEAREDFEAFGSWEAMQYIIDNEGGEEGYLQHVFSAPGVVLDLHGAPITDELGLSLDDIDEIIALETRPYYVVQGKHVPWEPTWEAFSEYVLANPGTVRYMGGGPGTNTDLNLAWYLRELELGDLFNPEDYVHVNVGGIAERVLAVAAGEGDITVSTVDAAQPHFDSGQLDLIFITGTQEVPAFPDVPNATDVGIEDVPLPGSTKEIVVPSGVDDCHVQWLYELYRTAAEDPEYVETRTAIPMSAPQLRSPEETDALNQQTYEETEQLMLDLGLHYTQIDQ
jgi:tripartite-type tricarboxylate transporter receptor subunit TctC